jgi:hypothetical protein
MEIIDLENPNKYQYSLFYNKLNSFFIDCMEELLMMMILRPTGHFFLFLLMQQNLLDISLHRQLHAKGREPDTWCVVERVTGYR